MSERPLAELLSFTRDGEWGAGEPAAGHVPVKIVRGTDFEKVRYGDLSTLPTRYLRTDIVEKKALKSGDILIETAGGTKDQPTGRTVYISQPVINAAGFPLLCASFARFLRPNREEADPAFLFWTLQNEYFTRALVPYHIQHTGVARFQYTQFASGHLLSIPDDIAEQQRIAGVLSALDDKIELNRRMNETLEEMAQAIFKDWFVDFGPVLRKQEGASDPIAIMGGLVQNAARAAELAALFPEGFGDDGSPRGWLEVPLGYFGKVSLGGLWGDDDASVKKEYSGFYCLRGVDLQHLRESGLAEKTPLRFANESNVQKRLPSSRDVLVASSGAGPCGRSLWVGIDKYFQKTPPIIYSNFVKRVSCESPEVACYVDRILHNMRLDGSIQAFISGTSVPNLNDKGLLESKLVCLPPSGLLLEFLQFSLLVQRKLFSGENLSLAETRDYLLPKLMSGEVRVREAERIAEDAL